jgi:hypothetical protein
LETIFLLEITLAYLASMDALSLFLSPAPHPSAAKPFIHRALCWENLGS